MYLCSVDPARKASVYKQVLPSHRVHIYYHYGIRSQKTIPIMVFEAKFHNSSVYGPSWLFTTSDCLLICIRISKPEP